MKALTIHQPWATALATGLKQYETRPRKTNHRGLMAIHAGKTMNELALTHTLSDVPFHEHVEIPLSRRWSGVLVEDFPTGCILAVGELTDCLLMDEDLISSISDQERLLGNWESGRYAYKLEHIKILPTPVPIGGKQGMWNWEPNADIAALLD